jgi:hypothetical protein
MSNTNVSHKPIWGKGQVVAYTGTAGTITNILPEGCYAVLVICTTFAYVKVGVDPTATTADLPVPANVATIIPIVDEPKAIVGGAAGLKVSAVQVAAGGNLHVIPLAY